MSLLAIILCLALNTALGNYISIPVHHHKHTSRRHLRSDPLPGNYDRDGEYGINLKLGGGGPVYLQLDTGSSDLGVATKECFGCSRSHDFYVPSADAVAMNCTWCDDHSTDDTTLSCKTHGSSSKKTCGYEISYADASGFGAELWLDKVSFDDQHEVSAYVGAMYSAREMFDGVVDGIVGFAGRGVSNANTPTPFDLLARSGACDNVFSLCFGHQGGQLYLGSIPDLMSDADVLWVPRKKSSAFYSFEMTGFLVGDKSIGVTDHSVYNDGDAIIDSGTSDCCLARFAFDALKATLASYCSSTCLKGVCDCDSGLPLENTIFENRCVDMNQEQREAFPDFTINMNGVKVVHKSADYLQDGTVFCDTGKYTISYSSCGGEGSGTILGDSFMQGVISIHDIENNRLGFLPRDSSKDCPSY